MRGGRPDWRMISAYVDGELPAQEAAAVAQAAETDADIAEQIALLYQLKGAVRATLPPAPDDLAEALPASPAPAGRRWWRAGLAVAVTVALAALVLPTLLERGAPAPAPRQHTQDGFLASARELHQTWLAGDKSQSVVLMPAVLDALTRFGRLPVVPDLQSTGLTIGLAGVFGQSGARVLQIGYRGHHGCHLSMFVSTDAPLPDLGLGVADPLERAHTWQVGGLTYLLLADGMDLGRFDLIAAKVEGASRRFAPLDSQDRQQLAENHRLAKTCAA